MPTYEYECNKCGKVFEEFQSITADPLTKCPVEGCGGKVRRLFSPGAGFLFKGSGFYATDYRSDSYKKAEKAEGSSSASSSSSDTSSKKSDSGTADSGRKSDSPKSD